MFISTVVKGILSFIYNITLFAQKKYYLYNWNEYKF